MRDIFLLIKDRHSYHKIKKVIKLIREPHKYLKKKFYIRRAFVWKLVSARRRLSLRRVVYHKKKYVWKWSARPFLNKKPFWRWKSYKAVRIARRAIKNAGHSLIGRPLTINRGWKIFDNEDNFYHTKGKFIDKKKLTLNFVFFTLLLNDVCDFFISLKFI